MLGKKSIFGGHEGLVQQLTAHFGYDSIFAGSKPGVEVGYGAAVASKLDKAGEIVLLAYPPTGAQSWTESSRIPDAEQCQNVLVAKANRIKLDVRCVVVVTYGFSLQYCRSGLHKSQFVR